MEVNKIINELERILSENYDYNIEINSKLLKDILTTLKTQQNELIVNEKILKYNFKENMKINRQNTKFKNKLRKIRNILEE